MRKPVFAFGAILAVLLFFTGCFLFREAESEDVTAVYLQAAIIVRDGNELLVADSDNGAILYEVSWNGVVIEDGKENSAGSDALEPGVLVRIAYDAIIQETSPIQIANCLGITIEGEAGLEVLEQGWRALEELGGYTVRSTGNPTAETFLAADPAIDLFVAGGTVYINAADIEWIDPLTEEELSRAEVVGAIVRSGIREQFRDWDATLLEVGTIVLRCPGRDDILVIFEEGGAAVYLMITEG